MGRKIRFEYRQPENMPVIHADGLYGGRGSTGDFILNIYQECPKPLTEEVYMLDDMNRLGDRVSCSEDGLTYQRDVVGRFALSETAARNIYVWLGKQLGAVKPREDTPADGFRIID